jgi:branched-chain amino acid transport system permease protein
VLSDHTVSILIFAGIDVIMALSFYLPASAGQLSAGQGGFMALGAYTAAYLTVQYGVPFPIALAAGGVIGGLVGLAVGFPALRLRGLYLVLVTFGFGEMVRVLFLNAPAFGGPGGFAGIPPATTVWHVLGLLLVLVYFFTRLSGSRMGRAFAALRDDEAAAEAMGVNSTYVKLAAFTAGGVIAGLGGALYAHYQEIVSNEGFTIDRSILFLAMVIIGGLGSVMGTLMGTVFMVLLPEAMEWVSASLRGGAIDQALALRNNIAFLREIAIGLVIVFFLVFEPDGLAHRWRRIKAYWKLYPFSY